MPKFMPMMPKMIRLWWLWQCIVGNDDYDAAVDGYDVADADSANADADDGNDSTCGLQLCHQLHRRNFLQWKLEAQMIPPLSEYIKNTSSFR